MKRSATVPLAVTALLAASLTGCAAEEDPDAYAICVDPETQVRVDDELCDDDRGGGFGGGFAFLYFGGIGGGRSYTAPAVGQSYAGSGGTTTRPAGVSQVGRVSSSGGLVAKGSGAVSRGGFGGTGRTSGG